MIGWRIIMGAYNYRNNIVFFFNFISYQPQKIANLFGYICISFAFQIVCKKKKRELLKNSLLNQCQYKWSLFRSLVYELDVHKIHRQIISFSLLMISCTRGPYIVTRIKSCQSIALILTWLE